MKQKTIDLYIRAWGIKDSSHRREAIEALWLLANAGMHMPQSKPGNKLCVIKF
jgi:hypothetical protein